MLPYTCRSQKHTPEQEKAGAVILIVENELEGIEYGCKRMYVRKVALDKGVLDMPRWQSEGTLDAQVVDILWW